MIDQKIGKECCGCKMCGDLCPQNAIKFTADHEGFWYPKVDDSRCIQCGLCIKRCPVLQHTKNESAFSPEVLCAWNMDEKIRIGSTSGGLYSALAETMLKQGGYISGCAFSDDWKSAKHILGNEKNILEKTRCSKYLQSDTEGIYRAVGKLLKEGKSVLFSGTPCQNAALREFLGREYNGLIQCDFVCRGINSPKAFQAYIQEMEQTHSSSVSSFQFKNKSQGWTMLGILTKFQNGQEEFTNKYTSPWMIGYLSCNLFMRPSCEHCRFKEIPRISDISLADFWGLDSTPENIQKGMSLVMVNTEKGRRFYEETLPLIHSESQTLEQAIAGNPCILVSPKYDHKKRTKFFAKIDTVPFSKLVLRLNRSVTVRAAIKKPFILAKRSIKKLLKGTKE